METKVRKIKVRDDNGCERCHGEGKYEVMHLRYDNEVEYYMHNCLCEELEVTVIRRVTPLEIVQGHMELIRNGLHA